MEFFTKLEDRAAEQISGGAGKGEQISTFIKLNSTNAKNAGFQNLNKFLKSGNSVTFSGGEFGPNNNNRSTDTVGEGVANGIANCPCTK